VEFGGGELVSTEGEGEALHARKIRERRIAGERAKRREERDKRRQEERAEKEEAYAAKHGSIRALHS